MPDAPDPANDNDLDDYDAHAIGLLDTLPIMPAARVDGSLHALKPVVVVDRPPAAP